MKRNIFKSICHYFHKLRWRYENWKAGMEHIPVDLGRKK